MAGMETPEKRRWYRPTPGWLVLGSLLLTGLIWLSSWLGWPAWHKGYAVLAAVAGVGMVLAVMLLWWLAALLFRWRFQFSIRSLLVLTLAVALPCSWLAVEAKRAKEQYKVLRGLQVVYEWQISAPGVLRPNATQPGPHWLRQLLGNDFFQDAFWVKVSNDGEIEQVKRLSRLQELSANGARLDDAAMAHISTLVELRDLRLTDTNVSDTGLQYLAGLSRLQRLTLKGTRITDAALKHLEGLTRLQELDLSGEPGGFFASMGFTNSIPTVPSRITDAGLQNLQGLSSLQKLNLRLTKVTEEGVKKLQQALPNCKVDYP